MPMVLPFIPLIAAGLGVGGSLLALRLEDHHSAANAFS